MDTQDQTAHELLEQLLEELRALREETARGAGLLEGILAKLDSIERNM
jgi:hypothetical protein